MVEVLLPFLLMKEQSILSSFEDTSHLQAQSSAMFSQGGIESKENFDLPYVYSYFKRFVQLYIPNTLHTKFNGRNNTLPYLKCSLNLT